MRDLLRDLREALSRGEERILCQVAETRGSTPQKAGALMTVDPEGGQAGTLGGGCVENEVKQKAMRLLGSAVAELHTFVLDHDYAWADGLICGGRMRILAESLAGPEPLRYISAYEELVDAGAGFTEAVVIDDSASGIGRLGSRFLFGPDGELRASRPESVGDQAPSGSVEPLANRPRPYVRDGVSFMPSLPRIRLVIVGAGHVGQATAELAAQADFDVWVIDDRKVYANAERFPQAKRILVGPIDQVLRDLKTDARTYALIVTRGHGHDQEALFHLAPTSASYVGLIGSSRKIKMIFEGLRAQGIAQKDLDRVTAPVGLDIGSQTVPEIAVSIVAQLIAKRNLTPRSKVRPE